MSVILPDHLALGADIDLAGAYGLHVVVDLHDCDLDTISSAAAIRQFADELLQLIQMDPYGEPFIERFALDNPTAAGYTLIQAITTSSITAHFSELMRRVYLDVFSCRLFQPEAVARFAGSFFGAAEYRTTVLIRQ